MGKKQKRKAGHRQGRFPGMAVKEAAVGLATLLSCESMEDLQKALGTMGFTVNRERFSELPPLPELKARVGHVPLLAE